jgi:predicted NUDIX family NTP pyrophosphohydrolase
MGGPFWANKDAGAWSIPKGELDDGEDPLAGARREFEEETGSRPPDGPALSLGEAKLRGGKRVVIWAVEGDFDVETLRSNTFTMEWPPRSGREAEFPEIDRAAWFGLATAREKLTKGQLPFVDRLEDALAGTAPAG